MYKKEIWHIIILIFYIIIVVFSTILVFIFIYSNSSKSYYLIKRKQGLLFITTLGVLSLGFLEIYCMGLTNHCNSVFIILKFNIYYFFAIPSYISYCYRGIIIYYNYIRNIENLYDNIKNMIIIKNKLIFIKRSCFSLLIVTFFYSLIVDILYFYNGLEINIKVFYPYYIIVGIYVFIMHPLIIYLLHKIKNDIKYDYIITMALIGIVFIIVMIFINNEYIVNYSESFSAILCYITYLIIPLIYIIKNSNIKSKDKQENNNLNFKTQLINLYNDYIEIKENSNSDNLKFLYKEFFKNKISHIKNTISNNNHFLVNLIDMIEYNIDNDKIIFDLFDKLFEQIKKIILMDSYEQNFLSQIIIE